MPRSPIPIASLVIVAVAAAGCARTGDHGGHHDVLVTALRHAAPRPLIEGDTLVTWTGEQPVLFHLARVRPGTVETALVRLDGMVGTARSEWSGATWQSARGEWRTGDSLVLTWSAERTPEGIRLRAARDTVLAMPTLPWAIADHGMDDQLGPVLRTLAAHDVPQAVAAWRPYAARWDTLTFAARDTAGLRVVRRLARDSVAEVILLARTGGILGVVRTDGSETRPLDGTPAAARWREGEALLWPGVR